jgi:hypothetical protein
MQGSVPSRCFDPAHALPLQGLPHGFIHVRPKKVRFTLCERDAVIRTEAGLRLFGSGRQSPRAYPFALAMQRGSRIGRTCMTL